MRRGQRAAWEIEVYRLWERVGREQTAHWSFRKNFKIAIPRCHGRVRRVVRVPNTPSHRGCKADLKGANVRRELIWVAHLNLADRSPELHTRESDQDVEGAFLVLERLQHLCEILGR